MILRARWVVLTLLCSGVMSAVQAAPPRNTDPAWPCQQIKVPEVSVAAVWAGPPVDAYLGTWSKDPDVADLADRLVETSASVAGRAFADCRFCQDKRA